MIAATDTVRGLKPGRYTITAGETSNDTAHFSPAIIEQSIDVGESQTVLVSVDYSIASATLALRVSGVPEGALAQLTVTGADSVPRNLTSSTVLRRLRPGTYRITAAAISLGLDVYRPSGFPRTVTLSASSTHTDVEIAYDLASGRLALSFLGLPAGVRPQGILTSPQQPDITFSSDTVLTGLPRGDSTSMRHQ